MVNSFKKRIQDLIANANTKQVIEQMNQINFIEKELKHELTLLNSRWNNLNSNIIRGLLSQEELNIELNRINKDLLLLNEKLPDGIKLFQNKMNVISKKLGVEVQEVEKMISNLEFVYSNRLKQKRGKHLPLNLNISYTHEGTSKDYVEAFFTKENRNLDVAPIDIINLIKANKHLLLLGSPGAGKSTLLIDIGLIWLKHNEEISIPIIFNLGSWNSESTSLKNWFEDSLVTGYGFSKLFAKRIISQNLIFPLLDGFDEIEFEINDIKKNQALRSRFLRLLDSYISDSNIELFILCSRQEEYHDIKQNAPVRGQVSLNNFNREKLIEEINKTLQLKISNKNRNVTIKIRNLLEFGSSEQLDVLSTPFYFNLVFDLNDFALSSSQIKLLPKGKKEFEEYLLKKYLSENLNWSDKDSLENIRFISWVGIWLEKHGKVTFELADFQSEDLDNPLLMTSIGGGIFGGIYGLFAGLSIGFLEGIDYYRDFGFINYFFETLKYNVISYIIGGFILGLFYNLISSPTLFTEEKRKINFKRFLEYKNWITIASKSIKTGIVISLIFSLIGFCIETFTISPTNIEDLFFDFLIFCIDEDGFVWYFFNVFWFGLIYSLVDNFIRETSEVVNFSMIESPYFRLKSGLKLKLLQFVVTILFCTGWVFLGLFLLEDFNLDDLDFLAFPTIFFIIGGFIFINLPIIKHFVIRFGLYIEGKVPLRFVNYLSIVTDKRILEKDGGQWRFRHKIIQNYFTNKTNTAGNRVG